MAREFAQIKLAIWADDDWRDLSPMARYLYLTLLTSPTLSHCGVADWRPARIGALNGMDPDEVEFYGAELVEALYVVIDETSEEILIRSFVRNDGLMKQPKMAVAMASAHAAVASQVIRGVIVHEITRLREDFPGLNGWGAERATDLLGKGSVDPSTYPLGKGSRKGKPTPIGKGSGKGSPTPAPTPTPTNSTVADPPSSAVADGQRAIEEDFADWYMRYPRKVGRGDALKAYRGARKKTDAETLVKALEAQVPLILRSEPRFQPHPSKWLNAERWLDDVDNAPAAPVPDAWFQPYSPPIAPPEIADDPELYEAWITEQRKADGR